METTETPRLSREDWIAAATADFEIGGVAAVRVEPLAKQLRVTRGSFYWHFADRDDLLFAILERWTTTATEAVIARNEANGGDRSERLLRLLETCAEDDGRLEMSIRAWAAEVPRAKAALDSIDARRTRYLEELLDAAPDAAARARVIYLAWLGTYTAGTGIAKALRVEAMRALWRMSIVR